MSHLIFLQDMAMVMAVSAVIMIFCRRLRLPVVLGYILAGLLIGPNTPPYSLVKDIHNIQILSELGVIFLLFSIGLEFSLSKLAKVAGVAIFAAAIEIALMIWIGFLAGRAFGWSLMDSIFLGAILSVSSTTIIAKVLMDMKKIKEKFAQVILGILIVEDLLAILIIALLSGVASTGSLELHAVGIATIRVFGFVAGVLAAGFLFVPRLLNYLERFESDEMTVITVLGLCFGVSLLAAKAGFSIALGAFLIGAVIAETKQAHDIVIKIDPIRDMFTAIFFVSVGMLLSPQIMAEYWLPILIITVITIVGKIFSCSFGTFLTGYSQETSLKVGLGLAQIGEFSFIIAQLGESTQVTSKFLYPIAVSVSGITTLTTPFFMRHAGPAVRFLERLTPRPLSTVLALYTGWISRLGGLRSERKEIIWRGLSIYAPRLLIYMLGAFVLFYGVSRARVHIPSLPEGVYWSICGIAFFPLFIGFVYTLDRILWNVLFLNLIKSRHKIETSEDVYRFLHNIFRFWMVFIIGLIFIGIGSQFLPRLPLTFAFAGLVAISAFFLWGSVRRMHEKVEKTVLKVFDSPKEAVQTGTRSAQVELAKLIREEYPWEVETEDFLVPFGETAMNQTIRDLHLRSETGATIVSIYRDENSIPNPAPEMKLLSGDVLLLMGDAQQIKDALLYLSKKAKQPPVAVRQELPPATQFFEIPENSQLLGKTLGEMRLRRKTGVTVLGIQKGKISITNPDQDTLVEKHDKLVLFGRPDQLENALRYLSAAES